jgi:hypothetical protein
VARAVAYENFLLLFFLMWSFMLLFTIPASFILGMLAWLLGFSLKLREYWFNTYWWVFLVVNFVLPTIGTICFWLKEKSEESKRR